MGKRLRRKGSTQASWSPNALVDTNSVDSLEKTTSSSNDDDQSVGLLKERKVKQKREESRSLRRKKKSGVFHNLLGNFPRDVSRTGHFEPGLVSKSEELTGIIPVDEALKTKIPQPELSESEAESLYQSRKLVMRQLINQGLKEKEKSVESEADSWTEIEEKFAKIYEPIPYSVAMDTWRSMSKEQMLDKVQSTRIKSEMKYMSRTEILRQIETMKNDREQKKKLEVTSSTTSKKTAPDAPVKKSQGEDRKTKNARPDFRQHIYQNGSSLMSASQGQSLADIYQAKVKAKKENSEATDYRTTSQIAGSIVAKETAVYVTRALVHVEAHGSASENEDQMYQAGRVFSRSRIIDNISTARQPAAHAKFMSRSELIERLRRKRDSLSSDVRSIDGGSQDARSSVHWSSTSCTSSCDEGCSDCDRCSACSCSSCDSVATVVRNRRPHERVYVVNGSSATIKTQREASVGSMPETRTSASAASVSSGSTTPEPVPLSQVKQRRMEIEKRRLLEEQEKLRELTKPAASVKRLEPSEPPSGSVQAEEKTADDAEKKIYEPVPSSQVRRKSDTKKRSKSVAQRRSKLLLQLKHKLKESIEAEGDPALLEQRQQELKDLLRQALDSGTETLSNINLGLIYVPMEENTKSIKALLRDATDYDTFGSIDSLIFEPKVPSAEDIEEVQEEVANHFEYLNEEYSSCSESSLSVSCSNISSQPPKNETQAATAVAGSALLAAVAASCEKSVSEAQASDPEEESECESVTSFNSVICQGQKLLDAETALSSRRSSQQYSGDQEVDHRTQRRHSVSHSEVTSELGTTSEICTNGDTDASWDYVDGNVEMDMLGSVRLKMDLEDNYRLSLEPFVVGNLRKRPMTSESHCSRGTEETTKLLESLRIAEESGVSSSLRLLFPTMKSSNSHAVTSFAQLASLSQSDAVVKPEESTASTFEKNTDGLDSLSSFEGPNSTEDVVVQEVVISPAELEMYCSKNGEPLYGARNARFLMTEYAMKTSFFETALIINSGSLERSTEDNASNKAEDSPSAEDNSAEVRSDKQEEKQTKSPTPRTAADQSESIVESAPPSTTLPSNKRRSFMGPLGMLRRDTMIRELKTKIKDRFKSETGSDALIKQPAENSKKEPMLSRLFGSLTSFGQKRQDSRDLKESLPSSNNLRSNKEAFIDDRGFAETYPPEFLNSCHHLKGHPHLPPTYHEEDSSIYDPSFPSDVPPYPYIDSYHSYPHYYYPDHIPYPFMSLPDYPVHFTEFDDGFYPVHPGWEDDYYTHEGLYSISQRLDDPAVIQGLDPLIEEVEVNPYFEADLREPGRPQEGHLQSWSDVESLIFAEDRSVPSVRIPSCSRQHMFYPPTTASLPPGVHPSRMSTYQDEWLFWDQLQKARAASVIENDEEKARRMMLWVHHSQAMQDLGINSQPPWWQVR